MLLIRQILLKFTLASYRSVVNVELPKFLFALVHQNINFHIDYITEIKLNVYNKFTNKNYKFINKKLTLFSKDKNLRLLLKKS